jgi:hypothetical protein
MDDFATKIFHIHLMDVFVYFMLTEIGEQSDLSCYGWWCGDYSIRREGWHFVCRSRGNRPFSLTPGHNYFTGV